mmetsp:Transcript_79370/g.257132  ORF Transcript_79370/g.257132 Transcript_79370/m.257132 type:complete len:179 (+) Transcript_79370:154-690(+)
MCVMLYLGARHVRPAWLASRAWHRRTAHGTMDCRESNEAGTNTHERWLGMLAMVTVMMHGVSATNPIPFLVPERWILSWDSRPEDQRYRLTELWVRVVVTRRQRRLGDFYRSEENEGAESIGELEEEMMSAEFDKVKDERDENKADRIDDSMKESTSEEHDSSTAEKKARARRAKRRA